MLKKLRQIFLMPCRLTRGIKQALLDYSLGKRKSISDYTLRSGEGEVSFTLIILSRRGCESETDPLKKYIPFATNTQKGKILWNVSMIPKDYRRRWGIESGYVGVEEFRARTTSRNHALRLLYFYYAMILYNACLLSNLILAKRFSKIFMHPVIPIELLKAVFQRMIVESFGGQVRSVKG